MKKVTAALQQVRNGTHDGLFTAYGPQEKNWGIAHRVLISAFGPISIRGMFDEMYDIASQLVFKWARYGPNTAIEVAEDFTRLTLDTLALCAMDYRFNSFYSPEMHPFIEAMGSFLSECGRRDQRPALIQSLMWKTQAQYDADISVLQRTGQEVIDTRRANPTDKMDFLNAMLNGKDPKTGEGLSDDNIIANMITFLIAGHETTSGTLSFLFYYLLKDPQAYQKAQKEVDDVIGREPINVGHLSKLPYITALLRETLRLQSPAPLFTLSSEDSPQILQGKYRVDAGEPIAVLLHQLHRDPKVWGDDAEEFRPERMTDGNFDRITTEYPNCWKPFGNGMRACIGRPFAWQEALLVIALLLQNFNFVAADPSYNLEVKQTLTIKPKDFRMRAIIRHGLSPTQLERHLGSGSAPVDAPKAGLEAAKTNGSSDSASGVPLSIFFGSNMGTCEALAHRLANDAAAHGFKVVGVDHLDSAREKLPKDHAVAIVLASYEGQPADNAAHFVTWLQGLTGKELEGVRYSVFGCGHSDWARTFHRIPKLVDRTLEERGARRLAPLGVTDQASTDTFTDFETWTDDLFWPSMSREFSTTASSKNQEQMRVNISAPRPAFLKQDVTPARVTASTALTPSDSSPVKRHLELELPPNLTYTCGDYLVVLPLNPKETTSRALRYFGLTPDTVLTLSIAGPTNLPTDTPLSAADLFGGYVELGQPASKKAVATLASLADAAADPASSPAATALAHLASDQFDAAITATRTTVLDLLERFHPAGLSLPLAQFLALHPPMRTRQYSISSSPLASGPSTATLTYAVLDEPSLSTPGRRHIGAASTYLASLAPGDALSVSVRRAHAAFRLPADAAATPVVMVAAGAGVAPFRGFVQERAALMRATSAAGKGGENGKGQKGKGKGLAPALLFFGCRGQGDDLYRGEFDEWERQGVVRVFRAYSREAGEKGDAAGCKYVQDRVWRERGVVRELWEKGAKLYVCGRGVIGQEVGRVMRRVFVEAGVCKTEEEAEKWWEGLRNERVAVDTFA
ncbi:Bifunctional cytochrome P450/NADPH--P450 reductase [Lasiodiplodia hormozganensis]|uniref:Bifunctional cytochrome P450/NADPH--P450 reductase n=1 Tax=Lasiodiplodia hormozganensis TaxID=869390 RepID=A0AA39XQG7_9PEZI|nr:Bifunctional cytochrome P450/NADPH--P450 reductase [Lasiodiplodia hormozganensis]